MNKLDLEETTRRFHNIYEQVAKEYGYKTREDTKELDFNSPNGMTMLKTVEMMTTPYLEEIERLNNIIEEYKNANEYHQNIIHELETMKQPNQLHSENVKLRAENNRLNNIINELEEYIKPFLYMLNGITDRDVYEQCQLDDFSMIMDKLQELKGVDKE